MNDPIHTRQQPVADTLLTKNATNFQCLSMTLYLYMTAVAKVEFQ